MASNHFQPLFGECGLRWTTETLRYCMLQGEPHTAAALALIPPHSPTRLQQSGLFSIIEYIAKQIPIRAGKNIPSPFGTVFEAMPAHHNLRIWGQWSVRQARALLGYQNTWYGWQHSDVAP
ncbi:hypothetical protein BCR39DRAFT_510050 [Naematelia encephala]|uniref:Uncharacterized protein n=1 Tax=Naematelia encephala TaxID=71784 RepID=A0A1Y2BLE2_9TREE|nr:hypothetical protein BCR39DRAFT_510050 [Naematelia encephala]